MKIKHPLPTYHKKTIILFSFHPKLCKAIYKYKFTTANLTTYLVQTLILLCITASNLILLFIEKATPVELIHHSKIDGQTKNAFILTHFN